MKQKAIGQLRHRAKIYRKTDIASGDSDMTEDLELIKEVWCSLEPVSAGIYLSGKQVGEDVTHRIFMRRIPDTTEEFEITTELEVHIDNMRYRPLRATDWEARGRFTVIEATQLGKVA